VSGEVSPNITGTWASDYLCCCIILMYTHARMHTQNQEASQYPSEYGHIPMYFWHLHGLAIQGRPQGQCVVAQDCIFLCPRVCWPVTNKLLQILNYKILLLQLQIILCQYYNNMYVQAEYIGY
jgi:hypothetical protein